MKKYKYNNFTLKIETATDEYTDYTANAVFPFKLSKLLDEQLDEATASVLRADIASFKPFAKCVITITHEAESKSTTFFISADNVTETPAGSGKYNHELSLIEETKWFERFIVPSTSFINPVKRVYGYSKSLVPFYEISRKFWQNNGFKSGLYINSSYTTETTDFSQQLPTMYSTSWLVSLFESEPRKLINNTTLYSPWKEDTTNGITVDFQDGYSLYENFRSKSSAWDDTSWSSLFKGSVNYWSLASTSLKSNTAYTVVIGSNKEVNTTSNAIYQKYSTVDAIGNPSYDWEKLTPVAIGESTYVEIKKGTATVSGVERTYYPSIKVYKAQTLTFYYSVLYNTVVKDTVEKTVYSGFSAVSKVYIYTEGQISEQEWTAYSVVARLLLRAEMLRKGDSPRFKISSLQEEWLKGIKMPDLNISECTLREALQTVGSYIHAEPRLDGDTLTFDKLGSNTETEFNFKELPYAQKNLQNSIEQFCSSISSTVDNIVNTVDENVGAIVEPYYNMYKSVRTENAFVRIQDDNMIIETDFPIQKVFSLVCGVPLGKQTQGASSYYTYQNVDLTKYLYVDGDYMRLSSYDCGLGLSKNYALYYTLNEKNIKGLNFKNESQYDSALVKYTIVNLIRLELEQTSLSSTVIDEALKNIEDNYPKLMFNISYSPVTGAKIRQNKSYTDFSFRPIESIYNQTASQIESKYYGEHLKGVIARLGNVSKTYTYIRRDLKTPNIGELYREDGKDYYITAVATEVQPQYVKTTVALSEDYNRYSDYISANRERRLFNISDSQAYDSYINYRDFIVISVGDALTSEPTEKDQPFMLQVAGMSLSGMLYNVSTKTTATACAVVATYDKDLEKLSNSVLPLRRFPNGNAIVFTFKFLDNYASGSTVTYIDGNVDVGGYFQNQVAYKDYYGNVEYMTVAFLNSYSGMSDGSIDNQVYIGADTPLEDYSALEYHNLGNASKQFGTLSTPYEMDIDRALHVSIGTDEIPTFTYQVEFVTDRQGVVIGSRLPFITSVTTTETRTTQFYWLTAPLNKFAEKIDLSTAFQDSSTTALFNSGNGFISAMTKSEGTEKTSKFNYNSKQLTVPKSSSQIKGWAIADNNGYLILGENKEYNEGETFYITFQSKRNFYK